MNPTLTILIATGNPGKAREIEAVLSVAERPGEAQSQIEAATTGLHHIEWKSLKDLGRAIQEPEETGLTFADNAALKARHYSKATGLWTLADDSGLEVDALNGDPGVRSARFADEIPDDAPRAVRDPANNKKLIRLLSGVSDTQRTARFRCSLALADGDRILATADGAIEGRIVDTPRGDKGFGYDPHFLVMELGKTTAEIESTHKNEISHRGRALRVMCERLRALLSQASRND